MEKAETIEAKKRQFVNKRIFNWGLVITALITLPSTALGISYSDFFRGFAASLLIWLLAVTFLVRRIDEKKISQPLLVGFLIGEVIIVVPMLSTYWILTILGQEGSVAGLFGFLVSLTAFLLTNTVLALRIYRLKNEIEFAEKGLKTIKELQKNPQLHK